MAFVVRNLKQQIFQLNQEPAGKYLLIWRRNESVVNIFNFIILRTYKLENKQCFIVTKVLYLELTMGRVDYSCPAS